MRGEANKVTSESNPANETAVFLLGEDPEVSTVIGHRLAHRGVTVREFSDIDALMSAKVPEREAILVLDLQILPEGQDIEGLLKRLEGRLGLHPDLFCIAHSMDLGQRLQALRAGALAYYVAPVSPDDVASRLAERSGHGPSDPYRVLVVDDQEAEASVAARVMDAAGMKTRILLEPLTVLEVMDEFHPDILLMDAHMPDATGIEMMDIIGEHDDFFRIPIILMDRESRPDERLDALRRGGGDVITKPLEPRRLVDLVQRRIQVSRMRNPRHGLSREMDPVSEVYNRQAFLKRLNQVLAYEGMNQGPGSGVLFIQLDSPQSVIERIGRGCRDSLMEHMGRRIRACLSPADTAGCIGDFSFGLLVRRSTEPDLTALAERLRDSIAEQDEVGGHGVTTVSVGIGLFRPRADDALTMLSRARKGCAKAQAAGGNRVAAGVTLVPATTFPGRDDRLAALVGGSLRSGGLELMYQPIVAMRKAPKAGRRYEAQLRLRAPDGEYIPPFDFLPVAHARGLMPDIDRWVMEHALDRFQKERGQHQKGLCFHIHQTLASAASDRWIPWLRDQIVDRDLIKTRPVIQFQLQDVTAHSEVAAERFAELQRLGIGICVIQFEEDPVALRMIERMPISLAKLSIKAVKEMSPDRLSPLVGNLHRQRCAVIATGIDNPYSIAQLWGCGVDFIQGHFLQFPTEDLGFDFSGAALK